MNLTTDPSVLSFYKKIKIKKILPQFQIKKREKIDQQFTF